ncbi:hypothetical protein LguiB_031947 [Lonicera macranthoides]
MGCKSLHETAGMMRKEARERFRKEFDQSFRPKYHVIRRRNNSDSNHRLWSNKLSENNNEHFLCLSKLHNGLLSRLMIFRAGDKGEGWMKIWNEITALLKNPNQVSTNDLLIEHEKSIHTTQARKEGRFTYVEAVKMESRQSNRNRMKKAYAPEQRFEDIKKVSQVNSKGGESVIKQDRWENSVICTRDSLWVEWGKITNAINDMFQNSFKLKPFQLDKALFWCRSEEEADLVANRGIFCINGLGSIKLQRGNTWDVTKT